MSYKIILCEGDSWTAGDLLDPKLEERGITYINSPENDSYRLPKVWPNMLGEISNIKVLNTAVAGSSNDGIVRRTLNQVIKLLEEYKPEDILVVIGWSSPERKDFFYNDGVVHKRWETLYPAELYQKHISKELQKFYELYVKYFWDVEEFSNRYIEQCLLISNFLDGFGIKYYFFNAFYESSIEGYTNLYDKYFKNKVRGIPDERALEFYEELTNLKGETDKVFFNEYRKIYNSHFLRISFKNFCDMIEANRLVKFDNNHPSYKMHKEWSKYLHKQLLTPEGYFGSD